MSASHEVKQIIIEIMSINQKIVWDFL